MKKILLLMVVASRAWGWDVRGNPDRYPSIGLDYAGSYLMGNETQHGPNYCRVASDLSTTNHALSADLRLPLTRNWTITVGGGIAYTSYHVDPAWGETRDTQVGPSGRVALRYYIH
jgi:hypothetical protein